VHPKDDVFNIRPQTFEERKEAVYETISEIPRDILAKVMENFQEQLHMYATRQSHHLDDKIFEK